MNPEPWPEVTADHREALDRVLASRYFTEGPEVAALEDEFADWLGVKYAVAVSNGTAAMMLGIQVAGAQDNVLWAPAFTFSGSVWGAPWLGKEVRWVDVDPRTVLAPAVDAPNLVVHLHGRAAEVNHWTVVEDCAQAFGTLDATGRHVGRQGVAAWSIGQHKTLWAGEGGIVTTNDPSQADELRSLRRFGEVPGTHNGPSLLRGAFNHKLSECDAALARASLRHLDRWIDNARSVAARMSDRLAGHPVIETPPWDPGCSWHKYRVSVHGRASVPEVMEKLAGVGVPSYRWQHLPLPMHAAFMTPGSWPGATMVAERSFCLGGERTPPCAWTDDQVDEWADGIWKALT